MTAPDPSAESAIEHLLVLAEVLNARLDSPDDVSTQELGQIAAALTKVYGEIRLTKREAAALAAGVPPDPRLGRVQIVKSDEVPRGA